MSVLLLGSISIILWLLVMEVSDRGTQSSLKRQIWITDCIVYGSLTTHRRWRRSLSAKVLAAGHTHSLGLIELESLYLCLGFG